MTRPARIHWHARLLSSGHVWTACGLVIDEASATRDCAEVTCRNAGCAAEAARRLAQRAELRARTWDELIELKDGHGSHCGDE